MPYNAKQIRNNKLIKMTPRRDVFSSYLVILSATLFLFVRGVTIMVSRTPGVNTGNYQQSWRTHLTDQSWMDSWLFEFVVVNLKKKKSKKRSFSKLDLCEWGSFSTAIFNSDIQVSFFLLLVFYISLSVCRVVKGNVCRKFAHCFV